MEKKFNEKTFYSYKFLNDCLPIYALYAILFKEKGLSIAEIALLFSFWSFVAILSEIPSGVLADRWNRKYIICIASVLKSICYVIWFFSHSFLMFAAGFIFWGISDSLATGTEESLIYDNLKNENRTDDFIKVYGRGRFFSSLGNIVGVISGGVLAYFIEINVISLMSTVIMILCFIFASQLKEKNFYSERMVKEKVSYFKTLHDAIKLCFKNYKILLGMVFLIFVICISTEYSDEFDALIIDDFGLGYIWLSIIFGIRFVLLAAGNHFADVIEKKIKFKNKVFILGLVGSGFMLAFSLIWNSYVLIIFGIFCMVMTVAEVIQMNVIQNEINEEGRATVMSLFGICQNIAMILFSSTIALLAGMYDLRMCYIIISMYCIIATAILFFVFIINKRMLLKKTEPVKITLK